MAEKKRAGGFARFMLVYALIFAAAVSVLVWIMTDFLRAYEASRPETFMQQYIAGLSDTGFLSAAEHADYKYDENLMTAEEMKALFISSLKTDISYKSDPALNEGDGKGYRILSGGAVAGKVLIRQGTEDDRKFGILAAPIENKLKSILGCSFAPWELVNESYSFSAPKTEPTSVTVPEDWSVVCNGYTLDSSYVTGEKQIAELAGLYGEFDIPVLKTYTVEAYTGGAGLRTFDPDGNEIMLGEEKENEQLFAAGLTTPDADNVYSSVEQFLKLYIAYCSGAEGDRHDNLKALRKVLVPDSDLDDRMVQALAGQYYTHSQGDVITELTVNFILSRESRIMADISYVLDTTGYNGTVTTVNNARVFFVLSDDSYLAEKIISC